MQEGGGASVATLPRTHARLLVVTIVAVVVDQVAKAIAGDVLEGGRRVAVLGEIFGFRLVRNPGGAFGVLSRAPLVFFAASALIVVGVLI
ncbi:MAG: signal peptidase II, partial [Actinomycetota bacterium]